MQAEDRPAFDRLLEELFGAQDRPLTDAKREGFWKSLAPMGLAEFSRCCELLLSELKERDAPQRFTVNSIWAAKRRLRAPAPQAKQPELGDSWGGDAWDMCANRHLLSYLMRRPRAPYTHEEIAVLVAYKRAWAQDMRESAVGGEMDKAEQRRQWEACIDRAEIEIARMRAPQPASAGS